MRFSLFIRRCSIALLLALSVLPAPVARADTAIPASAGIRQSLAPTGALRVALYPGTPTSVLSAADLRGVGYDLGKELAQRLGVPFKPVIYPKNADVLEAVKTGAADVAFTNASAERAKDMDFTDAYLAIELGYLARAQSPVTALDTVDRQGVRVGVTAKSSSDAVLSRGLKNAQVVRAITFDDGIKMLSEGAIDVYATNKASLFEMADRLPGSRVLDGSWGVERHSIAIPKGRDGGLAYAKTFATDAVANGLVKAAVARAGLRGAIAAQ